MLGAIFRRLSLRIYDIGQGGPSVAVWLTTGCLALFPDSFWSIDDNTF
jgi:hypothetical protein